MVKMERTYKIIISILFILAIIATFWSATRAEEGIITQKQLDTSDNSSSTIGKIVSTMSQSDDSSFDCVKRASALSNSNEVRNGDGQGLGTVIGRNGCSVKGVKEVGPNTSHKSVVGGEWSSSKVLIATTADAHAERSC